MKLHDLAAVLGKAQLFERLTTVASGQATAAEIPSM